MNHPSARRPSLDGCTVIELGLNEGGQYAGRLLAMLGARVIKIEPLDGDAARRSPPFIRDRAGRRRSIPYEYLNAGKLSLAADLDDVFVWDVVRELAQPSAGHNLLLVGAEHGEQVPPDLSMPVMISGPYGASGAKAHAPTTSFTRFHAGGSGYLIPAERPTVPGTHASDVFAGTGMAMAAVAMLVERNASGAGTQAEPPMDYSQHAHSVNLEKMFVGRVAKEGLELTRDSHRYPFGGAAPCKDGHVSMLIAEKHQWKGLCKAIGREEWIEDERFQGGAGRWKMQHLVNEALDGWCRSRTVEEVIARMREGNVPVGAVNRIEQVLESPVLKARGFLREAQTPFGPALSLGLPYGKDPLWHTDVVAHAPIAGEHTAQLLAQCASAGNDIDLLENLGLVRCEHADA